MVMILLKKRPLSHALCPALRSRHDPAARMHHALQSCLPDRGSFHPAPDRERLPIRFRRGHRAWWRRHGRRRTRLAGWALCIVCESQPVARRDSILAPEAASAREATTTQELAERSHCQGYDKSYDYGGPPSGLPPMSLQACACALGTGSPDCVAARGHDAGDREASIGRDQFVIRRMSQPQ